MGGGAPVPPVLSHVTLASRRHVGKHTHPDGPSSAPGPAGV